MPYAGDPGIADKHRARKTLKRKRQTGLPKTAVCYISANVGANAGNTIVQEIGHLFIVTDVTTYVSNCHFVDSRTNPTLAVWP